MVVRGDLVFQTRNVKGVPFFSRSYSKGGIGCIILIVFVGLLAKRF